MELIPDTVRSNEKFADTLSGARVWCIPLSSTLCGVIENPLQLQGKSRVHDEEERIEAGA